MTELLKLREDISNVDRALKKLDPDFGGLHLSRAEELTVSVLEESMNDQEVKWIKYWLYELECGEKATVDSVSSNGESIPIRTIDDLYDLLTWSTGRP